MLDGNVRDRLVARHCPAVAAPHGAPLRELAVGQHRFALAAGGSTSRPDRSVHVVHPVWFPCRGQLPLPYRRAAC